MPIVDSYIDSQVAVITLNNSAAGNLLNQAGLEALHRAFDSAIAQEAVRVIVLRAAGDPFCLGMDLEELQTMDQNAAQAEKTVSLYVKLLNNIYTAPQPIICVVQGAVKAGGVGLVGACDIVLAEEAASFEMSEVIFGLIPANVLPFIYSQRMAPQKIRYLVLTAKKIMALEAWQLNLVDEVMPAAELEKKTKSIIKKLFRAAPSALAKTKQFTREIFGEKTGPATQLAQETLLAMIKNPEVIKAIQAFNAGAAPSWFGKFKPEKSLIIEVKA